jgi:hypothetical protein
MIKTFCTSFLLGVAALATQCRLNLYPLSAGGLRRVQSEEYRHIFQ